MVGTLPKRHVKDLKKIFENLNDALDDTKHLDLGYKHYKEAKKRTLTLEREKKKRTTPSVQNIFSQPSDGQSLSDDQSTIQEFERKNERDLFKEKLTKPNGKHENGEVKKKVDKSKHEAQPKEKQLNNDNDITPQKKTFHDKEVQTEEIIDQNENKTNDETMEDKSEEIQKPDEKIEMETKEVEEVKKVESSDKEIQTEEEEPEVLAIPETCPLIHKVEDDILRKPLALLTLEELTELKKAIEEAEEEEKKKGDSPLFIQTDKDLVLIIMDVIHEAFYNPDTGFWPVYDVKFNREEYTRFGKPGWDAKKDSEDRAAAREFINVQKNEEINRVIQSKFVQDTTVDIYEVLQTIVSGVKYQQVARAIENHVRVHIYHLIYGQENVRNPKIYQQ